MEYALIMFSFRSGKYTILRTGTNKNQLELIANALNEASCSSDIIYQVEDFSTGDIDTTGKSWLITDLGRFSEED